MRLSETGQKDGEMSASLARAYFSGKPMTGGELRGWLQQLVSMGHGPPHFAEWFRAREGNPEAAKHLRLVADAPTEDLRLAVAALTEKLNSANEEIAQLRHSIPSKSSLVQINEAKSKASEAQYLAKGLAQDKDDLAEQLAKLRQDLEVANKRVSKTTIDVEAWSAEKSGLQSQLVRSEQKRRELEEELRGTKRRAEMAESGLRLAKEREAGAASRAELLRPAPSPIVPTAQAGDDAAHVAALVKSGRLTIEQALDMVRS